MTADSQPMAVAIVAVDAAGAAEVPSWIGELGLVVRTCATIEEALAAARETPPRLLVLDADLPCASFLDALKDTAGLMAESGRLVVVSEEPDPAWMVVCVASGADVFLVKPLERSTVMQAIDGSR